jgi:hypothetical protein
MDSPSRTGHINPTAAIRVLTTRHNSHPPRGTAPPRSARCSDVASDILLQPMAVLCLKLRRGAPHPSQPPAARILLSRKAGGCYPGRRIYSGAAVSYLVRSCEVVSYLAYFRRRNTRTIYRIRFLDGKNSYNTFTPTEAPRIISSVSHAGDFYAIHLLTVQ